MVVVSCFDIRVVRPTSLEDEAVAMLGLERVVRFFI
jgi:hypothetical protein